MTASQEDRDVIAQAAGIADESVEHFVRDQARAEAVEQVGAIIDALGHGATVEEIRSLPPLGSVQADIIEVTIRLSEGIEKLIEENFDTAIAEVAEQARETLAILEDADTGYIDLSDLADFDSRFGLN